MLGTLTRGLRPILLPREICASFVVFFSRDATPLQGRSRFLGDLAKTGLRDRGQSCFLSP